MPRALSFPRFVPVCALLWTVAAMPLPAASASLPALQHARTAIVVTSEDWGSRQGMLYRFVRDGAGWKPAARPFAVALGRNGSGWGEGLHPAQVDGPQKREGDGRSPAGVFAIGTAFGYAERIASALPYQPMRASSYCMDVPASPLYNRIVDAKRVGAQAVAGSSEPMRLDLHHAGDRRYREGFVIEHNPQAIPGHGSCIFAHLWRTPGEATAGCTAMEPADMQRLLAWLKPTDHPVFVLLPQAEYRRLQSAWSLPGLPETH